MDAFGVLEGMPGDYQAFVQGFLNMLGEQVTAKVDGIAGGPLWPKSSLAFGPAFVS